MTDSSIHEQTSSNRAYEPATIERKWQTYWEQEKTFSVTEDPNKPKYYVLDMFPYPSGSGLHVGHVLGYTATDILSRYKRARGFNVLHPMGWDAFGLPAEQYAIKTGTHPKVTTEKNIATFRNQLKALGFSYDWNREVNTSQPDYYRWTQFLFGKLYEKGLAYRANVAVNWCPALGTVLSNEEVINGRSERGNHPVYRIPMLQWMLRITAYAERLLDDLDSLDWPEYLKEMQRNWIGKSVGAQLHFKVDGVEEAIEVFTTRPDTLFGATYMVLAPEHQLVDKITTPEQSEAVKTYKEAAARKSDLDRTDLADEKTGVFTGSYAVNPVNGRKVPIWIADYVLASYGTGAIMAVPAHDSRDWEFAKKFGLEIIEVVRDPSAEQPHDFDNAPFEEEGVGVHSDFLDGLSTNEAKEKMIAWLEENEIGTSKTQYRLRDWLFSRQRYWGEPFPLVYTEDGEQHLLDPEELPLLLPEMSNFQPTGDAEPPLARATEWVETTYNGQPARRETNTMPQWAGSCWYYLRYIDPHNASAPWDPEKEKYWMNVDLYVGGTEHAVLHLLYARFWHKVFYDCGLVTTKEPFQRIVNQGMILGESFEYFVTPDGQPISYQQLDEFPDASPRTIHAKEVVWSEDKCPRHPEYGFELRQVTEKMSKSRNNVVNPVDVCDEYGADALRIYEMFMGPFEQMKPWTTSGVAGAFRFLCRVWRLICEPEELNKEIVDSPVAGELRREFHETIKKVTEDIEELRFNTAIAKLMELTNSLYKEASLPKEVLSTLVQLLAPFAPHISEELWVRLGGVSSVANVSWPTWDESALVVDSYELAVQVMGKLRGTIQVPMACDQEKAVAIATENPQIAAFLDGKTIRKVIFVPQRILNFVVG